MPLLFLGFVFVTLLWLLWAIAWVVVWAVVLLAWPLAVVLGAFLLFRAVTRGSLRLAETPFGRASPTGGDALHNAAFDDYRKETTHRLEEEQGKFREFLERMRKSKDREEFERFMAERRPRPSLPAA